MAAGAGRPRPPPIQAWEWVIAVLVVAAGAVTWVLLSRRLWFYGDAWGHLTRREIGSIRDILTPKGGHVSALNTVVMRILYGLFRLDYFPWYPAAAAVVRGASHLVTWVVLRRCGTTPAVALGGLGLFTVLGTSGWIRAWFVGNPIGLAVVAVVTYLIAVCPRPGWRDQAWLWALLAVGLAAGTMTLALLGGAVVCALFVSRLRRWWPALLGALALYGGWLILEGGNPAATEALGRFTSGIWGVVRLWQVALAAAFGLPDVFGWVLLAALGGGLLWLGLRRRLGLREGLLLLTALAYAVMVALVRVASGTTAETSRYSYNICMLLLIALLPLVAPPSKRWAMAAGAAAGVALIALNGWLLREDFARFRKLAVASRHLVESTGEMIAAGEPVSDAFLMAQREGFMNLADFELLLRDGWDPPLSGSAEEQESARGTLRVRVRNNVPGFGSLEPGVIADGAGKESCRLVGPGGLEATVQSAGALSLAPSADEPSAVAVEWRDEYGIGRVSFTRADRGFLDLAQPLTTARLSLRASPPVRACGFG